MQAVVRTGGKQYQVSPGQILEVDQLSAEPGSVVEFSDVLMVSDGEQVRVGTPTVAGALVRARVMGEAKGRKLIVLKFKPKVRYRRKLGHRQRYTRVAIEEVLTGSQAGI